MRVVNWILSNLDGNFFRSFTWAKEALTFWPKKPLGPMLLPSPLGWRGIIQTLCVPWRWHGITPGSTQKLKTNPVDDSIPPDETGVGSRRWDVFGSWLQSVESDVLRKIKLPMRFDREFLEVYIEHLGAGSQTAGVS